MKKTEQHLAECDTYKGVFKLRRVNDTYIWKLEGGYERYAKTKAGKQAGPEIAKRI